MSIFKFGFLAALIVGYSAKGSTEILYLHSLQGELASCGCSIAPMGGLDRFFELKKQLGQGPLVLLGGPIFSAVESLAPSELTAKKRKLEVEFQLLHELGVAAAFPWDYDFDYPQSMLLPLAEKYKIPLVSTNVKFQSPQMQRFIRVGDSLIVGVGSRAGGGTREGEWTEPDVAIREVLALQKTPPTTLVILTDFSLGEKQKLSAKLSIPQVWLGGNDLNVSGTLGRFSPTALSGVTSRRGHSAFYYKLENSKAATYCSAPTDKNCRPFEYKDYLLDDKYPTNNALSDVIKATSTQF